MIPIVISGLVLGVAVIAWLLVLSARTVVPPEDRPVRDRNRRGHGLGRWLSYHAGTRTRCTSWWSI